MLFAPGLTDWAARQLTRVRLQNQRGSSGIHTAAVMERRRAILHARTIRCNDGAQVKHPGPMLGDQALDPQPAATRAAVTGGYNGASKRCRTLFSASARRTVIIIDEAVGLAGCAGAPNDRIRRFHSATWICPVVGNPQWGEAIVAKQSELLKAV